MSPTAGQFNIHESDPNVLPGTRLLAEDGKQKLKKADDECCCGCFYEILPCISCLALELQPLQSEFDPLYRYFISCAAVREADEYRQHLAETLPDYSHEVPFEVEIKVGQTWGQIKSIPEVTFEEDE